MGRRLQSIVAIRAARHDSEGREQALEPAERRLEQADLLWRGSWLPLVLHGEALAGTDVASHVRCLEQVEALEQRWRDFLVPRVMDRQGLSASQLKALPRFAP